MSDFQIHETDNKVRLLMLVLLNTDTLSFLPELYDIFGEDKLMKFLDIFSGTKIEVPTRVQLSKSMRDVDIFCRLEYSKYKPTVDELAKEYEVSVNTVNNSYAKVKGLLENTSGVIVKVIK